MWCNFLGSTQRVRSSLKSVSWSLQGEGRGSMRLGRRPKSRHVLEGSIWPFAFRPPLSSFPLCFLSPRGPSGIRASEISQAPRSSQSGASGTGIHSHSSFLPCCPCTRPWLGRVSASDAMGGAPVLLLGRDICSALLPPRPCRRLLPSGPACGRTWASPLEPLSAQRHLARGCSGRPGTWCQRCPREHRPREAGDRGCVSPGWTCRACSGGRATLFTETDGGYGLNHVSPKIHRLMPQPQCDLLGIGPFGGCPR